MLNRVPLQQRQRTTNARARIHGARRRWMPLRLAVDAKPRLLGARWPPLMGLGLHALRRSAFGSRSAVVFRPFVAEMAYQAIRWSGIRTFDNDSLRSCSTRLSYTSGGHPGLEPGSLRCNL